MSREIKFRAWVKETETMWYSDSEKAEDKIYFLLINSSGPYLSPVHHEEYDEYTEFELMQYTGLKDRNGKEIYEGDVVKGKTHLGNIEVFTRFIGEVKFFAPKFQIEGVKKYNGVREEMNSSYEIIGNIYENPELLEGDNADAG